MSGDPRSSGPIRLGAIRFCREARSPVASADGVNPNMAVRCAAGLQPTDFRYAARGRPAAGTSCAARVVRPGLTEDPHLLPANLPPPEDDGDADYLDRIPIPGVALGDYRSP